MKMGYLPFYFIVKLLIELSIGVIDWPDIFSTGLPMPASILDTWSSCLSMIKTIGELTLYFVQNSHIAYLYSLRVVKTVLNLHKGSSPTDTWTIMFKIYPSKASLKNLL
jgi:hypothetical protein